MLFTVDACADACVDMHKAGKGPVKKRVKNITDVMSESPSTSAPAQPQPLPVSEVHRSHYGHLSNLAPSVDRPVRLPNGVSRKC